LSDKKFSYISKVMHMQGEHNRQKKMKAEKLKTKKELAENSIEIQKGEKNGSTTDKGE